MTEQSSATDPDDEPNTTIVPAMENEESSTASSSTTTSTMTTTNPIDTSSVDLKSLWKLEYEATKAFSDIINLSPRQMYLAYENMKKDAPESKLFSRYYLHNTVMHFIEECDRECKRRHLCET